MVLTARPGSESGTFEVDLGNRCMKLALDGAPKATHAHGVQRWVDALTKQEVLGGMADGACSHRRKFWKAEASQNKLSASRLGGLLTSAVGSVAFSSGTPR